MPSYERYETRRRQTYGLGSGRTAWGYWIPLAVTVGVATAGVVAWIWNERKDDDEDDDYPTPPGQFPQERPPERFNGPPASGSFPPSGPGGPSTEAFGPPSRGYQSGPPDQQSYTVTSEQRNFEDEGIVSRVSGALRRTPSPQQIFDVASKRMTAGVAAAGAAVGGALASISEEGKGGYEDHSRWSEEADSQNGSSKKGPQLRDTEAALTADQAIVQSKASASSSRKRKTVAIVISAEKQHEYEEDPGYHQEHAVRVNTLLSLSFSVDMILVGPVTSARTC